MKMIMLYHQLPIILIYNQSKKCDHYTDNTLRLYCSSCTIIQVLHTQTYIISYNIDEEDKSIFVIYIGNKKDKSITPKLFAKE